MLSGQTKRLLEVFNLVFFARDDLLEALTDLLMTFQLEDDELLVLFVLLGQLLVQLDELFRHLLHLTISLLLQSDTLLLHNLLFNQQLFDLAGGSTRLLLQRREQHVNGVKSRLLLILLEENVVDLFLVEPDVGTIRHIDLLFNVQFNSKTVEAEGAIKELVSLFDGFNSLWLYRVRIIIHLRDKLHECFLLVTFNRIIHTPFLLCDEDVIAGTLDHVVQVDDLGLLPSHQFLHILPLLYELFVISFDLVELAGQELELCLVDFTARCQLLLNHLFTHFNGFSLCMLQINLLLLLHLLEFIC